MAGSSYEALSTFSTDFAADYNASRVGLYVERQQTSTWHTLVALPNAPAVTATVEASNSTIVGYESFYVASLANRMDALHSTGAAIGIERLADGQVAYALRAAHVAGYLFVCSRAPSAALDMSLPYRAEARVRVSRAGWSATTNAAELRAWADLDDLDGKRQISLLPGCADVVTPATVAGLWESGGGGGSGSAITWRTLSSPLGLPAAGERVRVCVGVQSAASDVESGSPLVHVEALLLVSDERPASGPACAPSAALNAVEDLGSLVWRPPAPSSSGMSQTSLRPSQTTAVAAMGVSTTALIVVGAVLGIGLLTGLAWLLRMRDEGTLPPRTRMHDEDEGRPLTPERPPSHRSHPPHRGGAAGRGSSGRGSGEGRAPQWAPREGEAKDTIESTHAAIEVMSIGGHPKSRTRACGGGGNPISRGVAEASAGAASCAAYVG